MDMIEELRNFNVRYQRTVFIDPEEQRFYEFKNESEEACPIRLPDPAPATIEAAIELMQTETDAETDLERGFTEEEKNIRMLIIEYTTDLYDPETAKAILKNTYNIEWWIQETTLRFDVQTPKR